MEVLTPSPIYDQALFLPGAKEIKLIDLRKYDFSKFDLMIVPDAGTWDVIINSKKEKTPPKIPIVTIDHHYKHENFGKIDLFDVKASSASEIIYLMLCDWSFKFDKEIANCLLTGIMGDTGIYQFRNVTARVFKVSQELIEFGADRNWITLNAFRSYDIEMLLFWGELLKNLQVDKEHHFVWVALSNEVVSKYKHIGKAKSMAANLFIRMVKETDFGIVMVETIKNTLGISLRERNGFDVSKIARSLGGGGHKSSSAAEIRGVHFDEAVIKVLEVARKYAKKKITS